VAEEEGEEEEKWQFQSVMLLGSKRNKASFRCNIC